MSHSESSSSSRRVISRSRQPHETTEQTTNSSGSSTSGHSTNSRYNRTETGTSNSNTNSSSRTIISTNRSSSGLTVSNKDVNNKENTTSSTLTSSSQVNAQQHNMNYINKEYFNEDLELEDCDLLDESEWRKLVIEKFRDLVEEIKILNQDPAKNKAIIKEKYRQGLLICGTIKKLNRISHMKVNKARAKTYDEKNKIDEYHLELQNLLYEISHLQKEINKCMEFRSLDEDISLVSLEEFYAKCPLDISKIEVTKNDEHKLKLARLDWELIERQNMTGRIKELENQIDLHEQDIKTKQNKLESLNPKLNQIIEASKPTLEYFNTNFSDDCAFSEQVQYLPKPLYQFYMMTNAYRETIDKNITIEVNGDLEEAKRFNLSETLNFDDDDSDSNDDDNEAEVYKKKKSKSKNNKKKTSYREKLFTKYPLSCKLIINVPNYGQVILELSYLNFLRIVTVKSEIKLNGNKDAKTSSDSVTLKAESLFDCLYQDDDGLTSPNISNKFLFSNVGVKSIEPYLKQIGVPYRWCQVLCGLCYENKSDKNSIFRIIDAEYKLKSTGSSSSTNGSDMASLSSSAKTNDSTSASTSTSNEQKKTNGSVSTNPNNGNGSGNDENASLNTDDSHELNDTEIFEHIIGRLKSRFKARYVLQETFASLARNVIPATELYPQNNLDIRVQSKLTSWKEISFERYTSFAYTHHLIDSELKLNEYEWSFYEFTMLNGQAKLHGLVSIHQDYPHTTPLFVISINWKYDRTHINDEAIRDIERELNMHKDFILNESSVSLMRHVQRLTSKNSDSLNYELLIKQMNHLMICFDVYLESESHYLRNHEFPRIKLFPNSVRGRDRKRPYVYMSSKDLFVQRMADEPFSLLNDEQSTLNNSKSSIDQDMDVQ